MAEDRIATVRSFFETLSSRDVTGALAMLHPAFEFDFSRSRNTLQGVYRGPEELARFYENFIETFSEFEAFETEIVEIDGRVLRVGGFRTRGRGSGIELTASAATVWRFSGEIPVAATLYQSKADALDEEGFTK
jgi:ketosteroid isomerase-like protein